MCLECLHHLCLRIDHHLLFHVGYNLPAPFLVLDASFEPSESTIKKLLVRKSLYHPVIFNCSHEDIEPDFAPVITASICLEQGQPFL